MMARSFALAVVLAGCVVHTHETPESSMTSTTRATNATVPPPYDPHFRVSARIYEQCQLATRPSTDLAEGTAWCMKNGPMNEKRVRVMGSRDEVDAARNRLVGHGVDISRIATVYAEGPAKIEIIENTLGKRRDR